MELVGDSVRVEGRISEGDLDFVILIWKHVQEFDWPRVRNCGPEDVL